MAPVLALLSAVLYGTADFLGGLATRRAVVRRAVTGNAGADRAAALATTVIAQGAGLVLLTLSLPLVAAGPLSRAGAAWSVGAGLTGALGVALLYYGLAVGRVSVVAPVTAVCSIVIPVLVGAGLGERPSLLAIIGIVVAIASVALISRHDDPADAKKGADRSLPIALAAGVAIGAFLVCLARAGSSAPGLWPLLISRAAATLALAATARLSKAPIVLPRAAWPIAAACGALDVLANGLYLVAVRDGPLALVATLTSLYPASTVLLARLVLGERLRPMQSVGLACAAVAILLITSRLN